MTKECPKCGKEANQIDGYNCKFVDGKIVKSGCVFKCETCTQTVPGAFCESLIEIPLTFNEEGNRVV